MTGGILRAKGWDTAADTSLIIANNDFFYRAQARVLPLFPASRATLFPRLSFQHVNLYAGEVALNQASAGLGVNVNIRKGFFWAGLEGLYDRNSYFSDSTKTAVGGKVSFGIERTLWWNWFIIRVGGQKVWTYNTTQYSPNAPISNKSATSQWYENPSSDGSDSDLVGLGFGINVENRLRIDCVASEDMLYTLANVLNSPERYIVSRISATYSF